jgi:predicted transcriptional regulator
MMEKPRGREQPQAVSLCHLLGNPIAFAAVELLANHNELNPSEIARAVGRRMQRVSTVLSALPGRYVRYDTNGKCNLYRLKHHSTSANALA